MSESKSPAHSSAVTLFIPCLVDQLYPQIGIAFAKILKSFGYKLKYNPDAVCCGQPAFNSGHLDEALRVASLFVDAMKEAELLVCPSGSCTAMVRKFFPSLFDGTKRKAQAERLAQSTFEFSEFLARENLIEAVHGKFAGRVGFHKSCHSARELGLGDEPLKLMKQISGYELIEIEGEPVCCGFGGIFSAKFPAVAHTMATTRLEMFTSRQVDTIVSNDPGCIMHLKKEAKVNAQAKNVEIMHLTEFLAKAMGL